MAILPIVVIIAHIPMLDLTICSALSILFLLLIPEAPVVQWKLRVVSRFLNCWSDNDGVLTNLLLWLLHCEACFIDSSEGDKGKRYGPVTSDTSTSTDRHINNTSELAKVSSQIIGSHIRLYSSNKDASGM